jgi:short subunit dehydrogenase-like uncharacterized protein
MPDILLFGATGYTGRLAAEALARRGADFAVAGRNIMKLEALAARTGEPEVRVAEVGNVDGLTSALDGCRVLISCVGPFAQLGDTAVEAALNAGTHYLDSTGEVTFVARMIDRYDAKARTAGVALAPSIGFDEVPADVAVTLACEEMKEPEAVLTYALPGTASVGTLRSALGIMTSSGWWVRGGSLVEVRAGQATRWAPMPAPLGPRLGSAAPLAIGRLAPLHIDFSSLEIYVTQGAVRNVAMKVGLPAIRLLRSFGPARQALDALVGRLPEGPDATGRRSKWTVLAEAFTPTAGRNVALIGRDAYGLTGELLAAGAMHMCGPDYAQSGVVSPVQALGLDVLQKELADLDVTIEVF